MSGLVVDCDFWAERAEATAIAPYLDRSWRELLRPGRQPFGHGPGGFILPEGGIRTLKPPPPASEGDPRDHAKGYLDREAIGYALLDPGTAGAISGLNSEAFGGATARATNDWLAGEWLEADDRFRGSILVTPRDAKGAAAEIRRVAEDGRFVQVLVAYPPNHLGDQTLQPLVEAAQECGLPINLQASGAYSGSNRGTAPFGFPTSPLEDQLGWTFAPQPHLISLITRGVFDRYPGLRLVLSGFGAAWLAPLVWRMDLEAHAGRLDAAATLSRLPSEYVRHHVRLTTQPLELPADGSSLFSLLEPLGGAELLLYASGHPRWRDSDAGRAPRAALPEEWKARVLAQNAQELYRLESAPGRSD
jgi:uncharacterized protein